MALYLTHPSSMVGRIVHKGDVFVSGNDVYVAKLTGYPVINSIQKSNNNAICGLYYSHYTLDSYNNSKGISYTWLNIFYTEFNDALGDSDKHYIENRLPIPKGTVWCLIHNENNADITNCDMDAYVTTSACYLSSLVYSSVGIPVKNKHNQSYSSPNVHGWSYHGVYSVGDYIVFNGYIYKCIKDHTSENTPDSETEHTYWEIFAEARTTSLDYVWGATLAAIQPQRLMINEDETFISDFWYYRDCSGGVCDKKDIEKKVQGILYTTYPIVKYKQPLIGYYYPPNDLYHTNLALVQMLHPISVGLYGSPNLNTYDINNGKALVENLYPHPGPQLSEYCPYLSSQKIIPETNFISPDTVDAYYAGQVFSDGTYIYYVWKTTVAALSSCSVKIPYVSIVDKDKIIFIPPISWLTNTENHGRYMSLFPGIFVNMYGQNTEKKACYNLGFSHEVAEFITWKLDNLDVCVPCFESYEADIILTNFNNLVLWAVKTTSLDFKDDIQWGAPSVGRGINPNDSLVGRFVADCTNYNRFYTKDDGSFDRDKESFSVIADVYYVLNDDNKYGNIDTWLSDKSYTVWCFRARVCDQNIIAVNKDADIYFKKYGTSISAKKTVDLSTVKVKISNLNGFSSLPQKMQDAISDVEVELPRPKDPDVPSSAYQVPSTDNTKINDPKTGKPQAHLVVNPSATDVNLHYNIEPNVKQGDIGEGDDTDDCVIDNGNVIYQANESGGSFDDVSKTEIGKYYNGFPIYSSKEIADSLSSSSGELYFNESKQIIYRKSNTDLDTVGEEVYNGGAVVFYANKLNIIATLAGNGNVTIKKDSFWVYKDNIYKSKIDQYDTTNLDINPSYFSWEGRYVRYASSCDNIVNMPILAEDNFNCDLVAGNNVIINNSENDNEGIIINIVSPAPKGQLKLENQIVIGNVKKNVFQIEENILENGVDVDYRENSVRVTNTEADSTDKVSYAKGTLFYLDKTKTAYYATNDCTYTEIYKICPVDYYVYKNNDECQLPHGIKYLIYKDSSRNEELKIYDRKDYAIVDTNVPEYYLNGNDVYRKVDDISERDKTADKLVARFSNNVLVWLEDKENNPNSNCKDYGIYDNDTLIWYETTFNTFHSNAFYIYKDKIYEVLKCDVDSTKFGDLNYSGLYGQLYAQGKMLIWYCPPVINLLEGTVFKYEYGIYVADEDITVEDWEKADISKLAVTKIGFVDLHTEDCKTIIGDIILYDTEYPQCYIFNVNEKVDITSSLLVDKDILNEVSNETIIKIKHPTNIKEITKSPESHTIVATKNILDASGTYRWLYHSFDKTAEIKGNFIYNKDDESIYFVENICKTVKVISKLPVNYYVYKNNDNCKLPHGIKYLIYKDASRNEKLRTLLKKDILDSEMVKSYADYYLDGDNIYKFSDNKLVARFSNNVLVLLEDKDREDKPDNSCKDYGIYDNDEFIWYDTIFKTLHKNVFYVHNDKVYLTGNNDVTDDKLGDTNYSSLYGQLYAQGKILIWYCPPAMKFIKGTVFLYNYNVYVADEDITISDLNKFNIADVKVTKIGFVDLHTDDCKVVYGDIVLYDTEYAQCYIFNVNEKVDITVPLLVDTHVFNSISTETIVQIKELGNIATVTKNVENNTVIATKNILDESNEYRWLYHTYDKTAETKNHYIYDKDKDIIYFVEDICTTIEKFGYNYNLLEFMCPIPCKMPYGISHKIYRLTGMYDNNMYINRIFIYYKEEHARPESYFLDGDFVYYKDKDGNNIKFGKYVNGELVAYNCYIDKNHSEDLFKIIGLYEDSLDLFFFYATAVSKIFSGIVFLDESKIYIATTNIGNVSDINTGNSIKIGAMTCGDNIPIFDIIYIDKPTLYYVDGNTVYRLIAKKDSVQPWRVSVGAKGYFRLNIIPHIEEFALNINEYPKDCCYTLRIGDLIYTGSDYSNPQPGDKIYEIKTEVCANKLEPEDVKEICYYGYIDCLGKNKWIYKYYEDSEYINKMFVEIRNKDKDIYNIYLYKCYTSEIDGNKYCVYEEVCSQVGCMKPVELTADIPVKFPDYIGVTDQRVWSKTLTGRTISLRGCDLNINDWSLYKVELGSSNTSIVFHYNENYIYTWNTITNEFSIMDKTTGNYIFNKKDCHTLSDLNIDLDIVSSCNFILIVEDKTVDSLLISVNKQTVVGTATQEKYNYGVNNTYYADRVRPYNKDDADNPTHNTYNVMSLVNTEEAFTEEWHIETTKPNIEDGSDSVDPEYRMKLIMDNVFNKYVQTTYVPPTTKMLPNNYVYLADKYMPFTAIDTKKKLRVTQMKFTIVLSELSICLYNMLLSIQRPEETVNNRQIYEPWLVWGFYKLIYSKGTIAEDVPIIYPIFDLSPVYG